MNWKKPLISTISQHSKHVVVHTERDDRPEPIKKGKRALTKELKALLSPKRPIYNVHILEHHSFRVIFQAEPQVVTQQGCSSHSLSILKQ